MDTPLSVYEETIGGMSKPDGCLPEGIHVPRSCIGPVVRDIREHGALLNPVRVGLEEEITQLKKMAVQTLVQGGPDAVQRQEMRYWLNQVDIDSKTIDSRDIYRAVYNECGKFSQQGLDAYNGARRCIVALFPKSVSVGLKVPIHDLAFNLYQMVICHAAHTSAQAMLRKKIQAPEQGTVLDDSGVIGRYREESIQKAGRELRLDVLFHQYVALVCSEVCAFAYRDHDRRFEGGFPLLLRKSGRGRDMAEFLIGLDWLMKSYHQDGWARESETDGLEMPKIVMGYLHIVRDRILEEGIFEHGSSWYERANMAQFGMDQSCSRPSDDYMICIYCVTHFTLMMEYRTQFIIEHLAYGNMFQECSWPKKQRMSTSMATAVLRLLDTLLTDHFGIVFYTHASAIILSSIFCTAKLAEVPVRFSDLQLAASTCFPLHSKDTFKKIGEEKMDLRQFYNEVFLPTVYYYSENDLYGETLHAAKEAQFVQ